MEVVGTDVVLVIWDDQESLRRKLDSAALKGKQRS